jgi:Icc-related predicted phosphoesterase
VLKILFATDFHGAEVCFRKLFNLAPRAKADVIVIGGDLCGKALVPLVDRHGVYEGEFLGRRFALESSSELQEMEKRIRFNGFYPLRCDHDEYRRLQADPAHLEAVMDRELTATVERWLEIADEKLNGSDAICVSIPGNDDEPAIDAALNSSSRVRNVDGKLIDFGEFQVMGYGASNRTPWNSPREFSEEVILQRLRETGATMDPDRPLVANIHVPPYRSTLDEAPMIDDELRPVLKGGNPVSAPVGSHAVRSFIEEYQPLVSLHGHIHESRSATRIGRTLAVNPGSDYSSGTLQAVIVSVDLRKNKAKGHQFISG